MRKLLLCAAAALMTVSMSAQKFTKYGNAAKAKQSSSYFKANVSKPARQTVASGKIYKDLAVGQVNFAGVKNLKAVERNFRANSQRRAGVVQPEYTGMATISGRGTSPWTMQTGTSASEALLIKDVIPNPYPDSFTNGLVVEYTYTAGTITIARQIMFSSSSWVAFLESNAADGAIVLNVNEDGSITVPEGETIYYMAYTDSAGVNSLGYVTRAQNITYLLPGQVVAPKVSFEPASLLLNAHLSTTGYSFRNNYTMVSPYVELPFTNLTTDIADSWLWSDTLMASEPVVSTFTERDLKLPTIGGNQYSTPVLVGSNEGAKSEPYQWNGSAPAYMFAGDMGSSYQMSDESYAMMTKACPAYDFAYYGFLGTPDVNTQKYSIHNMILYQGKPASPLYFTGVNMMVRDFKVTEGQTFTLKCKIVKVTRSNTGSLQIGDVIAEADVNPEVTQMGTYNYYFIDWDEFYVEDEFGLSTTLDYLMLDDEFAVILEGWDNGTFTAVPYGEYDYNELTQINTYAQDTGDERIYSYTKGSMMLGFKNAIYGYLYTADNTNINVPVEGGKVKIHVRPMLYNPEAGDGEMQTILALDENIEGNELPEWLSHTIENEVYTNEDFGFDLMFDVAALPEGTNSRSVELTYIQPGAKLVVNVNQGKLGDLNGDGEVNGSDLTAMVNIILGQKEQTAAADLNGDGEVNGTDLTSIVNIILTNTASAPAMSMAPAQAADGAAALSIESFNIEAGGTAEMKIDLTNPNDQITLVQFDMYLPAGLSISKDGDDYEADLARTSYKKHSLDFGTFDDFTRFLLWSSKNIVLDGNSGTIITVKLKADATFNGGTIQLKKILLVTPDEKETKYDLYEYTIGTDGIRGITASDDVTVDGPVFNLAGQRLQTPQKGINIIGGKKVIVK